MIPNRLHMSLSDKFYTIHNLQRSPIPQTSNWSETYSKPALVQHFSPNFFCEWKSLKKNLVEQNRTVMSFAALRIPVQHIVDQGTLLLEPKHPFGYC
mgnify:CR=1 FL=1